MQIQQDNFIQRLLNLEKGGRYPPKDGFAVANIPDLRKKRTWYLKKLSDAKLVKYIRRGNSHAFTVLIRRHEVKIKYILRVNLFDKSQVDDACQDVWEKVVHYLRSRGYRETGRFYGWLSTVAFSQAMLMNRGKLYSPEKVEYNAEVHDVEDSVDDASVDPRLAEVQKIISTFSNRDQEIIRKHYYERLSFEVISREMKIPSNILRKCHFRIIKKIRDRILVKEN